MTQAPVLIGGQAAAHWRPGMLHRAPGDWDYLVASKEEARPQLPAEADLIQAPSLMAAYKFSGPIASLDELLTLKVSHSPWYFSNGSWWRHLEDIKSLQLAGASVIEPLYTAAYKQWEEVHGAKQVNLSQDKEEFFGPGVRRRYLHDSVHAAVAFGERPLFEKLLAEGETVKVSQENFLKLTEEEKIRLVQEEVAVLALERQLIPRFEEAPEREGRPLGTPDRLALRQAYREELCLLITERSKGWWPRWIIEHFWECCSPGRDYWRQFQESPLKERLA